METAQANAGAGCRVAKNVAVALGTNYDARRRWVDHGAVETSGRHRGYERRRIRDGFSAQDIGFVGISLSEPLLQGGILASVMGYMIYLEPWMAALCPLFFLPQLVFVPLMQWAINRRAEARIRTMREVSSGIASSILDRLDVPTESRRIDHVFVLNMGIYKLKYSMNMAMNLMYYFSVAAALGVGGWFAVEGRVRRQDH